MRIRFATACAMVVALTAAGVHAQPAPTRDVRFAFDLTGGGDYF